MKTLTFTLEDALISPIGLAILTGAGLINKTDTTDKVHIHKTIIATSTFDIGGTGKATFDLSDGLDTDDVICDIAPLFVLEMKEDSLTGKAFTATSVGNKKITISETGATGSVTVMVDCYVLKNEASVQEVQIDAENFAGYYYVEGETYFRKQINGKDMPAYLTIPNVKIQSNFTFTMASSGDPSELMRLAA